VNEEKMLDESIDPASYVSFVRDWLIPEAVQRLVAALATVAESWVQNQIPKGAYRTTLEIVLEEPDKEPQSLRELLLGCRDWRPIALTLTALRCLEEDCRAGEYERPLPKAERDVVIAALQWQIELAESDGRSGV
jgi:hypothetical protein